MTKDLKEFKEAQPARSRQRKLDLEEVKRTGKIDDKTRQEWLFNLQYLEETMRQIQEFDMVWKDIAAMVAKVGTDLKKDLALIEAAGSGSDGAKFKANNLLRQQADAIEAVVKRSQLLKSDFNTLYDFIQRDNSISQEDQKIFVDIQGSSTVEIEKTLKLLEGTLKVIAEGLRKGLE
ncbi:MAG: hypothetical protein IT168_05295 [Bryobacterales bacterium]|nr:hypothetical protein [Bryobacterales bacterium]